ncbi:MAG: F0F1 ATP synthase subunit A [Bacteroidia bacterium]
MKKIFAIAFAAILFANYSFANEPEGKGGFDASSTIMHHILESHDWEITEYPKGDGTYGSFGIHLPWLLYSSRDGVKFYGSTEAMNHSKEYIADSHGKVYAVKSGATPAHTEPTHEHGETPATHEETHKSEAHGEATHEAKGAHHAPANADESVAVYDFSPSKTVVQMLIVALLLIIIMRSVAKGYITNKGKAPSGIQSFFEPIIVFVRDFAKENIGPKYEKFMPYLLTLFFFIWFSNMFGLMPFNSNIAGNISVTAALAVLTLIIMVANGTKDFWMHMILPPGVPLGIQQLLTVIEIASNLLIKPVALAIRLFANIAAGHFMVLSLVCLIFIFGKAGQSVGGAIGGTVMGIPFAIGIMILETLVAIVQAYIFTLLTTVFLGQAMESHDHHEEGHAHH